MYDHILRVGQTVKFVKNIGFVNDYHARFIGQTGKVMRASANFCGCYIIKFKDGEATLYPQEVEVIRESDSSLPAPAPVKRGGIGWK